MVANDRAIIEKIKDCFDSQGHQVIPAYDIPLGFFLAQKNFPDLILSEPVLKDGDAFELLSEIRSEPDLTGIPFVIVDNTDGSAINMEDAEKYGISMTIKLSESTGYIISELLPLINERLSKKPDRKEYSPE